MPATRDRYGEDFMLVPLKCIGCCLSARASGFYGLQVSLYGLTAEPGKVYYFRARTTGGRSSAAGRGFGDEAASIDLDPVNPDAGKRLVRCSQFSSSHLKK